MTDPVLAVTRPDGTRMYTNPATGETAPSVTTILKYISKPALTSWGAKTTARYAAEHWDDLTEMDPADRLETLIKVHEEESRPKRERGTLVHALCEAFAKGTMPVIEKSIDSYMTQFFKFLGEVSPRYVETEATMWNRQYGYAGTCDAVAVIGKDTVLIDIKTSPRCYPEHGLQVSALSHCEFIIGDDGTEWEMPPITKHALLNLRPRSWKLIEVKEIEACYMAFLAARKIYHFQNEIAHRVLG